MTVVIEYVRRGCETSILYFTVSVLGFKVFATAMYYSDAQKIAKGYVMMIAWSAGMLVDGSQIGWI